MKKIIYLFLLLIGTSFAQAQEVQKAQESVWHTDLKESIALGQKENKPLFLFFTGSDWCGWCIRLQREVFQTEEFNKWASENVILVELDFPRRKPQSEQLMGQNQALQNFFQVQGFPTVIIAKSQLMEDGKISFEPLGKTGYEAGGPSVWLNSANQILAVGASKK